MKLPPKTLQSLKQFAIEKDNETVNAVLDKRTGRLLEYKQLISHPKYKEDWLLSSANEFGCLAQGVGNRINGIDTIFFIHEHEVPENGFRDTTYAKFVCNESPEKKEVNRT